MVCVSILQRGQYGEVCVFASTLCRYDLRNGDLFGPRYDECLGSVVPVVFTSGARV